MGSSASSSARAFSCCRWLRSPTGCPETAAWARSMNCRPCPDLDVGTVNTAVRSGLAAASTAFAVDFPKPSWA